MFSFTCWMNPICSMVLVYLPVYIGWFLRDRFWRAVLCWKDLVCLAFVDVIVVFPLIVFPSAGFTPWSKNSHEWEQGKGKGIVKEGKGNNRKGRGKGKEKERKRKGKGKRKRKEKERKRKGKGTEKETEKERKKEMSDEKEQERGRKKERRRKRKSKGRDRKKEREKKRKKKAVSHTDHFWCQKLSCSFSFCHRSWILCVCVFLFFWQSSKKECSDHLPGTFLVQNLRHYDNKQWKEETKSTK